MNKEIITFFDTTLRDGEQTPNVSLTDEQKLTIAKALDKLGVDVIEAGFPISSKGEYNAVKSIVETGLRATVCGLARVVKSDIDACFGTGVELIHVFASTSDVQLEYSMKKTRQEVYDLSIDAVEYVKDHGTKCLFSAMDATRTEMNFLQHICRGVELSLIHISEPTRLGMISYAVFCLKKKKKKQKIKTTNNQQ